MATITKIIFTLPNSAEQKYSLSRDGTYLLGTSEDCDITLDDPALGEKHGQLAADETNEGRWFLKILESGSIVVLEDGSEEQIGHTHLQVSITEAIEEDDEVEDDEKSEEKPAPIFSTDDPTDNDDQLEALMKAQQQRELKNAVILVVVCAILSFAAGVAWRLIQNS